MLKKWIDEIRNQPDLYKSECWKYHLSGNVVEISILQEYIKQKKLYRCSVIAVGQVLQALSRYIEEKQLSFHIQSFPNLESPEIVASIRIDQKGNFSNDPRSLQIYKNQDLDPKTTLKNLTESHQFFLRKVENPSDLELDGDEISFESSNCWFVIYSTHNNPFTWLKVGYLKESLRNQNFQSSADSLNIYDLCSLSIDQYSNLQISKHEYVQALVGIQAESMPTK